MVSAARPAAADEPLRGRPAIGVGGAWLHAIDVSGGIDAKTSYGMGPFHASAQPYSTFVEAYADWQFTDVLAAGLGVPFTIDAASPSSDGYNIGVAARVKVGYPRYQAVYPYLIASLGPSWLNCPQHVWLSGMFLSAGAGVSIRPTKAVSFVGELTYQRQSYSGDMPLFGGAPGAPIGPGNVLGHYLAVGGGFEIRL